MKKTLKCLAALLVCFSALAYSNSRISLPSHIISDHPVTRLNATGNVKSLFSVAPDTTFIRLDSLSALRSYAGSSTSVFVSDSLRGGLFQYYAAGLSADSGTVFPATGKGGGFWKRQFNQSTGLNVQWFGAKGDGVTDDGSAIQQAVRTARAKNLVLNFVKTKNPYFATQSFYLGDNIIIRGNGATLNDVPVNLSVKAVFVLDTLINPASNIEIDGLNLTGTTEVKFITSKFGSGGAPSPRYLINSIKITNCTAENRPITIDFNPTFIEIRNVTLGLKLVSTDVANPAITISHDPTFTTGRSLILDNVYLYRGNKDGDMFFIKGDSYQDVRVTNCTANSLASIPSGTGDGFDMDSFGKNATINNIRTINTGIEIKSGTTIFGTYNLQASNLFAINPANAGISLRASGQYSNIFVQNPVGTGLTLAGYAPTDGSTQRDMYIDVNNVQVANAGAKLSTSPMVSIGLDNIHINNMHLFNEFGTKPAYVNGIRFNSCKNVTLSNVLIKNAANAISTNTASIIDSLTLNNISVVNCTTKIFSLAGASMTDWSVDGFKYENFTGTVPIGLSSVVFKNIRFTNFPADLTATWVSMSSFNTVSQNFLMNNTVYDKVTVWGATPFINPSFPIGSFITVVADGNLWFRKNNTTVVQYAQVISPALSGTPTAPTAPLTVNSNQIATTANVMSHFVTASASLDFPSTPAQSSSELTITVAGAADGDVVTLGISPSSDNADTNYTARVSAANTVSIKFNNYSALVKDPASGVFKVTVLK